MEIFTELINFNQKFSNIAVALGTFDGVHKGHQKIIAQAVKFAARHNGTSAVFTFSNHPLSILAPDRCPPQIVTQEEKACLIQAMGIDILITIPFSVDFLRLSPQQFISLLVGKLQPAHIVVGPNYSFGYQSSGTPEMLKNAAQEYQFDVKIYPAVFENSLLISSTTIRQMITQGAVEDAAELLGRPFSIGGQVIQGDARGRRIGYPTANLAIPGGLVVPADGVYSVQVCLDGALYYGVANVGDNPTFKDQQRRIEVHILDFADNIYDKQVKVSFLSRLRGEIKFASLEELKQQIAADIQAVRHGFILS